MTRRFADLMGGSDPYPAEEPQAANDRRPKVQPMPARPDYTQVEPSSTPKEYQWVLVGKDQVMIHPTATHDLMLEMSQHGHFSRPHAKGTLHLFDNWEAHFELLSSNMNLDLVRKALKKAAKQHGWDFYNLVDETGYPFSMDETGRSASVNPADRRRNNKLKSRHGITASQYDEILNRQDGTCAICQGVCRTGRALAVDHCHKTGVIRGLLCGSCNVALGHFSDSPALLDKAISHLQSDPYIPLPKPPEVKIDDYELGQRLCVACSEWKPFSRYCKRSSPRTDLVRKCKDCQADDRRARKEGRPVASTRPPKTEASHVAEKSGRARKSVISERKYALKKYGLTLEDHGALMERQGGACRICRNPPDEGRNLDVDHCHSTNTVRGLLCRLCNLGVGGFQDSVEVIRAAKRYLALIDEDGLPHSEKAASTKTSMPYQNNVWYHVTHRDRLRSIRDHGLTPTDRGNAGKNWDEYSVITGGVYLSPNISSSETYRQDDSPLMQQTGWQGGDGVILRITQIDQRRLHPDPEEMTYELEEAAAYEPYIEDYPQLEPLIRATVQAGGFDKAGQNAWTAYSALAPEQQEAVRQWWQDTRPTGAWVYLGTIPAQFIEIASYPGEEYGEDWESTTGISVDDLASESIDDDSDQYAGQYQYRPLMGRVAADFGNGPINPGVKDYRNKEWAGTDQWDQMPPPGWDDAPDESHPNHGPYECSECGEHFPDYGAWRQHVSDMHTTVPSRDEDAKPLINGDATFTPKLMDWSRVQDQAGVVAGWKEAAQDWVDYFAPDFPAKRSPEEQAKLDEMAEQKQREMADRPHPNAYWHRQDAPDSLMQYAEMVPVEHLLPALEWDRRPNAPKLDWPGGEQLAQGADQDYWDVLKNDIAQKGMLTPVFLDYNAETGKAHISEGNHRVRAAQELGMTHVPVVVYPSRRRSQGGSIQLSPGQHHGEYGKPSKYGLSTQETPNA